MSQFLFAVSRLPVTAAQRAQLVEIAVKHEVDFVEGKFPGIGYQRWFAGPNLGFPFDRDLASSVAADMRASRVDDGSLIGDREVRVVDGWTVRERDGRQIRKATATDRRLSRAHGGGTFTAGI